MEKRTFMLSRAEAELALRIVNYFVYNSSIDAQSDADGIFLEGEHSLTYIPAEDTPTLIRLLQRLRLYPCLDQKILDAITEQ